MTHQSIAIETKIKRLLFGCLTALALCLSASHWPYHCPNNWPGHRRNLSRCGYRIR